MSFQTRFRFIAHALNGTGGFRPAVTYTGSGTTLTPKAPKETYLVRYPRESESKFARRNEVAFYESDLARHCSRFSSYIASKPAARDLKSELYRVMEDDIDGKGNNIDVFFESFRVEAKARGSMLLLVDMPDEMPADRQAQRQQRAAPYWAAIEPERIADYALGDDGRFTFVEFAGNFVKPSGEVVPVTWYFDAVKWHAKQNQEGGTAVILDSGPHNLGECPVLIYTERGDFPCFGAFSPIADLSRRLFNLNSELDEILRSQTFSLLTMQVKEGIKEDEKLAIAQTSGETIGTQNMLMHTGSTPAFIAPSDGPARVYLDRIEKIQERIDLIGLSPSGSNSQESGYALQMRFAAINAELSKCAERMEDLERRAWELSRRWLGITEEADIAWPRDFNIADIEQELRILQEMQVSNMPGGVQRQQQKRIVVTQFNGADAETIDAMTAEIDQAGSME